MSGLYYQSEPHVLSVDPTEEPSGRTNKNQLKKSRIPAAGFDKESTLLYVNPPPKQRAPLSKTTATWLKSKDLGLKTDSPREAEDPHWRHSTRSFGAPITYQVTY